MRRFRKAAAVLAAVAVLSTACAINAYAATQDTVATATMNTKDEDSKILQWDISLLKGEDVKKVVIKMKIKDGGGWFGGGGAFGFNQEGDDWNQTDFGTNEKNMVIDEEGNGVATIEFSKPVKPAEKGVVQLGWWWASGDVSDFVDLEINGKSVLGVTGVQKKPEEATEEKAEETTAATTEAPKTEATTEATTAEEEEVVEETTAAADEEEEEEWVSTFDPSTVAFDADQAPYFDGLQFCLRADNDAQQSIEKDYGFGFDITEVYGIRVFVEVDPEDVEHGAWYGGSVGANCPSRGWYQHNYANGDGDELTYDESEGSITFMDKEPIFSADDAYAFAFFQQWGTPIAPTKFELLDKNGDVIDYVTAGTLTGPTGLVSEDEVIEAAPAAGDVAAATDSTKGSPNTGIEDVAAVAGIAAVAAGALFLSRKRK
ncbi:MAG: hypothetical protein II820_02015 [Ruminiclostridium sp.]|nr:hypothetical protein [Ruminiclostridium sp.]